MFILYCSPQFHDKVKNCNTICIVNITVSQADNVYAAMFACEELKRTTPYYRFHDKSQALPFPENVVHMSRDIC